MGNALLKEEIEYKSEAELELESVIASIAEWEGKSFQYTPVLGGLQNAGWKVMVDNQSYFVKIPGAGSESFIDRHVANIASKQAGDLGIAPKTILFDPVTKVEITEFLEGYRACTNSDMKNREIPLQIVELYKKFNASPQLPSTKTILDMIDEHIAQAKELQVKLPQYIASLFAEYEQAKNALLASGIDLAPCHNDPMPGNFMISDHNPMKMIDYEFASNNERAYELAVMVTEYFYPENLVLEMIEQYYQNVRWETVARVQICSALADLKWGLWGCVNHQLIRAWGFDYHKYGEWKLMRSRNKMSDPRWAFWLKSI